MSPLQTGRHWTRSYSHNPLVYANDARLLGLQGDSVRRTCKSIFILRTKTTRIPRKRAALTRAKEQLEDSYFAFLRDLAPFVSLHPV